MKPATRASQPDLVVSRK